LIGVAVRNKDAANPDERAFRSNCAARVAGSVPKTTPTSVAAASAITADNPEMGMRYEVKSLTE
jgi:hypothetical protein